MNAYPETPDNWIERQDEDFPNQDDACMVCDKIECVCPPEERNGWSPEKPSGTVKQGRRPMFKPFDDPDDTCPKCGSSVCTHIWELEPSPETRLEYTLGGKDDPHFQDHGGNVLPDQWLLNQIGHERD